MHYKRSVQSRWENLKRKMSIEWKSNLTMMPLWLECCLPSSCCSHNFGGVTACLELRWKGARQFRPFFKRAGQNGLKRQEGNSQISWRPKTQMIKCKEILLGFLYNILFSSNKTCSHGTRPYVRKRYHMGASWGNISYDKKVVKVTSFSRYQCRR